MSRKITRNGMRREAELRGYRPSAFVHTMWERLQIALLGGGDKGVKRRVINQAKGSRLKKNWRMNIEAAVQ